MSGRLKIGFLLDTFKRLDYVISDSSINNGIGGTQHVTLRTAITLSQHQMFQVYLLLPERQRVEELPSTIKLVRIADIANEVGKFCQKANLEILVDSTQYRNLSPNVLDDFINSLGSTRYIARFTTNPRPSILTALSSSNRCVACVTGGQQQWDALRWHDIITKTVNIDSFFDHAPYRKFVRPYRPKSNIITYVGALYPVKGFDVLARAWPEIASKVPNAKLNVIGSATLYREDVELGGYGLAESRYERTFMRWLVLRNGEIDPRVKFFGRMGVERLNIMSQSSIVVANPRGISETSCAVAKEAASLGIPLVAYRGYAFLDFSVPQSTSILVRGSRQLARKIIWLLNSPGTLESMSANSLQYSATFTPEYTNERWAALLLKASRTSTLYQKPPLSMSYCFHRGKVFREFSRRMKLQWPAVMLSKVLYSARERFRALVG